MKKKKFTEKQIDQFWSFVRDGGLEYLSEIDEDDMLENVTDRLHTIEEGKYFRQALSSQDAIEAFDERAEIGELFALTAKRIARKGEDLREHLDSAAEEMGVVIVKPLDNADTDNRRRIADFFGIRWYSTDEQIVEALKSWL